MGFEIDYLPVGKQGGEKSGDSIAMRFWDESPGDSFIITIDGGTKYSGSELVEHVKKYYAKTAEVNMAILTHPEADHAYGLRCILEGLEVHNLILLVPWDHAAEILQIVQRADNRVTEESIRDRLRDAFPAALEAVEIAEKQGVKIIEPFAGRSDKLTENTYIHFLGPTKEDYLNLWLPNFDCLPEQPSDEESLFEKVAKTVQKGVKWIKETWNQELLTDPSNDEVSAENNSGLIFAVKHNDKKFLFCGDAGVPALNSALTFGEGIGLSADSYTFFHVPHHGSRHNLGPTILNRIFGLPKKEPDDEKKATAYISATKGDDKHPSRRVTNALNRRGVNVFTTQGVGKFHHSDDYQDRGWSEAKPIEFFDEVEDVE